MYAKGQNSTGLSTADFNWGTPHFAEMGRQKAALTQHFLRLGVSELILCDSDAMFLEDPRAFFASYPEADMLSHTDANMPTIPPGDPGLERASVMHTMLNIGLLVLRNTSAMRASLDKWMEGLVADPGKWDQAVFDEPITGRTEGLQPLASYIETQRIVPVWDGSLNMGVLPIASFTPGPVAFAQKLAAKMRVPQYTVHATFGAGFKGKRLSLRELMLFADPPDQIFNPSLLGPPNFDVPVREHSFFDNPRGPPQLPSDAMVASTRRTPWCSSSVEADTLLEVQSGLSERQLRDVLGRGSPADGRRQLHVLDPLTVWSRFEAPEDEHRFSNQFLSVLLSLERADTRVSPYRDWFVRPPEFRRSLDQNYTTG